MHNVQLGLITGVLVALGGSTLAESLACVPGGAIERDEGRACCVNLCGVPFRYRAIANNGIDLPGAENGRIPRFDRFPAFITSKLTVNKAITANMSGEAASGFVDIETNNPFDREGVSLALDGGLSEQDLGGDDVDLEEAAKTNAFAAVMLEYGEGQDTTRANPLVTAQGKPFLRFTLDALKARYGSIEAFLTKELGPGSADLQRLRDLYLTQ